MKIDLSKTHLPFLYSDKDLAVDLYLKMCDDLYLIPNTALLGNHVYKGNGIGKRYIAINIVDHPILIKISIDLIEDKYRVDTKINNRYKVSYFTDRNKMINFINEVGVNYVQSV